MSAVSTLRPPVRPRRMRDHLGDLTMLGIANVTERTEGRDGGRYREYTLQTIPEMVINALAETSRAAGGHYVDYSMMKSRCSVTFAPPTSAGSMSSRRLSGGLADASNSTFRTAESSSSGRLISNVLLS